MDEAERARLASLVDGARRDPRTVRERGATEDELAALADRLGAPVPTDLADWLRICRGEAIGEGGVFGVRPDRAFVDITATASLFPEWSALGWIPVASDGCGNYYVLQPDGSVGFIDTMADPVKVEKARARSLPQFLMDYLAANQAPD